MQVDEFTAREIKEKFSKLTMLDTLGELREAFDGWAPEIRTEKCPYTHSRTPGKTLYFIGSMGQLTTQRHIDTVRRLYDINEPHIVALEAGFRPVNRCPKGDLFFAYAIYRHYDTPHVTGTRAYGRAFFTVEQRDRFIAEEPTPEKTDGWQPANTYTKMVEVGAHGLPKYYHPVQRVFFTPPQPITFEVDDLVVA
jgi:hypothetical protein